MVVQFERRDYQQALDACIIACNVARTEELSAEMIFGTRNDLRFWC